MVTLLVRSLLVLIVFRDNENSRRFMGFGGSGVICC